jgi:hypothetical protein
MKQLKSISSADGVSQWNSFVRHHAHPPRISFNPSLLNFYSSFFNWKPFYFLIYDENRLVGVFPLVETEHKFVSLPHFSYGGFISVKGSRFNSSDYMQMLIRLIRKENPKPGFLAVYENSIKLSEWDDPILKNEKLFVRSLCDFDGAGKSNKVCSFIQLPENTTEMLKLLSSNLRRKLRKTMTNKLEAKQGGAELLDVFYPVYAHNMHRLGSPVFSKSFFQAIFDNYKNGAVRIFLSEINGKIVGAAFLMSYFGFYENTWFSSNRAYKKYFVSDHLHWQMIQYAIANKGEVYSMGRSTLAESVHRYKKHWPVSDNPLFQIDTQEKAVQLKNQKWLAGLWKTIPYPITLRLGPMLVKHIY